MARGLDIMKLRKGIKDHKLYAALIGVTAFTSILMLISFEYIDVISITAWSLNFWDLLFEGRVDEFYQYAAENIRGADYPNCSGNYLWLLPVCIWNLPLWIVHKIGGIVSVHYFFSLCWTKLFWLFAQIVTALFGRKICLHLTGNEKKGNLAFLLIFASPEIMVSVGYAGQDEIIYICLFMIALWYYLNEKWWKCYALMVCCVSICPIMLLPCLVLILLKEKNIIKLFGYTAGTVFPTVLFELLYRNDAIYQIVKQRHDFGTLILEFFGEFQMMPGVSKLSYSLIALLFLYCVCYVAGKLEDKKDQDRRDIFFVAAAFFILCFLMSMDFYRAFMWVPAFTILILSSGENMRIKLFLFAILTYGRTFLMCQSGWTYSYVLNTEYVMPWLRKLSLRQTDTCFSDYIHSFVGETMMQLMVLVLTNLVMVIAILLLVLFVKKKKLSVEEKFISDTKSVILYTCCMPLMMLAFLFMLF